MSEPDVDSSSADVDLRQWVESREGLSIRAHTPPTCGYCGGEIEPGAVSSQYASTLDLNQTEQNGSLMFQRHYCGHCDRDEITHPCREAYEVLVEHRLTDGYRITELEVADASRLGEGYPWTPSEVCSEVLERSPEELATGGREKVGPEDVIDSVALYGIPPEHILKPGGGLVSEGQIEQVQEQMEFVSEELTFRGEKQQTEWVRSQPYPPTGRIEFPAGAGELENV